MRKPAPRCCPTILNLVGPESPVLQASEAMLTFFKLMAILPSVSRKLATVCNYHTCAPDCYHRETAWGGYYLCGRGMPQLITIGFLDIWLESDSHHTCIAAAHSNGHWDEARQSSRESPDASPTAAARGRGRLKGATSGHRKNPSEEQVGSNQACLNASVSMLTSVPPLCAVLMCMVPWTPPMCC